MTGTVDVADVVDSHKVSCYQYLIAFIAWHVVSTAFRQPRHGMSSKA